MILTVRKKVQKHSYWCHRKNMGVIGGVLVGDLGGVLGRVLGRVLGGVLDGVLGGVLALCIYHNKCTQSKYKGFMYSISHTILLSSAIIIVKK